MMAAPAAAALSPHAGVARVGLTRLLHLASTLLPVGAYSYSQGLEWAIESGTVRDRPGAEHWIRDCLFLSLARFEAPLLAAVYRAWLQNDDAEADRLNGQMKATRESSELLAETLQLGYSLRQWCRDAQSLEPGWLQRVEQIEAPTYPVVFGAVAAAWGFAAVEMVTVYLWSWLENQVSAGMKALPLGQTDGQRILLAGAAWIDALATGIVLHSESAASGRWPTQCPGLAIASSCHEAQYSRLFRS